jgi:hypothetical protein
VHGWRRVVECVGLLGHILVLIAQLIDSRRELRICHPQGSELNYSCIFL